MNLQNWPAIKSQKRLLWQATLGFRFKLTARSDGARKVRLKLIEFAKTKRTTLKRLPKRAVFDRKKIYAILDEGFVCHIGFVVDGQPFVIPTSYGRAKDDLFVHGSAASRMLRALAGSIEVCVTVTLIDGLVLARSAFHHSMNYRSVVIFGRAGVVQDTSQKLEALRAISEHIIPRRWDAVREPNANELKATLVLRLPLIEASAKIRTGPPLDDEADYELLTWAGEIPLRLVAQTPVPDPRLSKTAQIPSHIDSYLRRNTEAKRPTSDSEITEDSKAQPEILVRIAVPEDAGAVAVVLEQAFVEYRERYTDEGFIATVLKKEKIEARMAEGPVWVALEDEKIVGTVAAVSKGKDLYVRSMGVVPTARGKRIGEWLLKKLEDYAIAHGHSRMTLSTTPFLLRAIRLYERLGFRQSDEGPSDLFGTPLFTMTKELSAPDHQSPSTERTLN